MRARSQRNAEPRGYKTAGSLVKIDEFPHSAENSVVEESARSFASSISQWLERAKFQLSSIADVPFANKYLSSVNDNN